MNHLQAYVYNKSGTSDIAIRLEKQSYPTCFNLCMMKLPNINLDEWVLNHITEDEL